MTERKKQTPALVHPDERPRIAALNQMSALLDGMPESKNSVSYYTPELIQCTLPHRDPKVRDWIRTSGPHTLIVSSGVTKTGDVIGIPYGSFPRLVLAYIITSVVKNGERRIEFKSFFRTFLKEIGYTDSPSVRNAKTLQDGLRRLINATITYEYDDKIKQARRQFAVAPTSVLFWNYKVPEQGGLWDSYIEISEEFRRSIIGAPVPLRTDMLAALKISPLAIDLYMWVSYRLYMLQKTGQESLTLSYGSLQQQFGTGIAATNYRSFRRDLKVALERVKETWATVSLTDGAKLTLQCEAGKKGLTLFRSPLLIAQKTSKAEEEAQSQLPGGFKPSPATLRKARQLAGNWNMDKLIEDYQGWLARKNISPQNPSAHFIQFVRTHCQRNGSLA